MRSIPKEKYEVYPIFSAHSSQWDTRFQASDPFVKEVENNFTDVIFENYDNLLRAKGTYRGVIEEDHGKWFNVKIKGKAGSYIKSFDKVDLLNGTLTVKIV